MSQASASVGIGPTTCSTEQQSESQRIYVQQRYPPNKLWSLSSDYQQLRPMDLSLRMGTLLGVVKESDPMGDKERWFVDDGGTLRLVFFS